MIKVTNGKDVLEVTEGYYKNFLKKLGFTKVKEATKKNEKAKEASDDFKFADLLEKPLSQWNKIEVKEYAEYAGLDITGTKNIAEAKAIIKNSLD